MSRNIKFEIKLKAKEAVNGYKPGEEVVIVNTIFDIQTGIAFWPIDKNFEIVYKRQYIGIKDKNGKEIYEGDFIGDAGAYIIWSEKLYCWCFKFNGDKIETPLFYDDVTTFEVTGNIYENPELLK